MRKMHKALSLILVACMLFGLLPVISVAAADATPGGFLEVVTVSGGGGWGGGGSNYYQSTINSNAFNVILYNNTFSGTFGDQHMSAIELSLHNKRIATNGDLHLLPTPEQWDATPAPSKGNVSVNGNVATIPMTYNSGNSGRLTYNLVSTPTADGVLLEMILTSDMPEKLQGKARFNLDLLPAAFQSKSYQGDRNGDGVYDDFGTFPLHAQDAMIDTERADLNQEWYVKNWNRDRGDAQPAPIAVARGFDFSAEDQQTHITFTSMTDDDIELYDGRNRAQNGWYVISTLISATKAGEKAASWLIQPDVEEGWVREPNVGFSQVGYTPNQKEKFAVVELDKWDNDYPRTMSLYRLNADGSETKVKEGPLVQSNGQEGTTNWMRFKYARFDFTDVHEKGLYRLHYGDQVMEVFPIAEDVYDNVWQSCLSGFMAVQMDHIEVREGYKIWHGASHMDDGRLPPANVNSWFDGMGTGTIPDSVKRLGYTNGDHVPGLNQGGWFDAGDFDLQMNSNFTVWENLIAAAEATNNMDGYDTLAVSWNEATGGTAEMHRPDGVPDVVQQIIHGSKQVLAQYEALGGCGGTMEVNALRLYTHLGDPSSDTDGYIYDPKLGPDEIVERDGQMYSGMDDDRYLLMGGGGGSFSTSMWGRADEFAATAYVAAPYEPEYAARVFNAALKILKDERSGNISASDWGPLVQFTLASDALEKNGIKYNDEGKYTAKYFRDILDGALESQLSNPNLGNNLSLLYLIPLLGEEYKDRLRSAAASYAASNSSVNNGIYGLGFTSGPNWGGSPNTYNNQRVPSLIYYNFPEEAEALEQNILRSVNYLMGRHPATNASWISGVGTKSAMHPYNSNRAEESFIPGSILPGHITFGDYVESMDDFSFLWFEGESIVTYQSNWIAVGLAAGKIAAKEAAKKPAQPAESKDFTSNLDLKMVYSEKSGYQMNPETGRFEMVPVPEGYLSDKGFDVIMYSSVFDRGFGDQHWAGIELVQNGRRVATNGDIHLLPTPEQWDATPAPVRDNRTFDKETNTITVPMTFPAETDPETAEEINPAISYELIAVPEAGGVKLTVKLAEPLPADVVGKAGFNLEFLPAVYIGKSYQADSDGDGTYDSFGTFPVTAFDEMESVERTRTANQAWYVQQWNDDRGDAQPLPLATGTKMTFAAEDDDYRIRITSEDGLALYDGRNRAQNGWFVLRTLIPEGATEIVWHISPDTTSGWTREPNIGHSQAGYEPGIQKVATIELDPNYVGSNEASLKRVNEDGSYTTVFTAKLGEAKSWQRYTYRDFDFSEVKTPGMYVIDYDGTVTDVFPIKKGAYAKSWQQSLSNYLAVQMDHVKVREGYKIWHNISHYDDALLAPNGLSWFDYPGSSYVNVTANDSGYEPYEHIPGLNVGGWADAGDFDIQVSRNVQVIQDLALAYQEFQMDYDTLDCNWDTRYVELHRPDGIPDVVNQVKHGVLQIIGELENIGKPDLEAGEIGYLASVLEVQSLRQYTHLGDGAKDTDGLIYNPELKDGEVYGQYAGKNDDRLAFAPQKNSSSQLGAAACLAAAADVLKGYDDALAEKCLKYAEIIWNEEDHSSASGFFGPTDFNAAVELFNTTGKDVYKDRILELFDASITTSGGFGGGSFGSRGWKLCKVIDKLGEEQQAAYVEALTAYAPTLEAPNAAFPYGVPTTATATWGSIDSVVNNAQIVAVLHHHYPEIVSSEALFRDVNYVLGNHPANNTSWISGVGTKTIEHGYGSNRADRYYIAGGIIPGYVTISPDLPEQMDDFNFLWFENEYVINTAATWVLVGYAANEFARELDEPCEHEYSAKVTEPTCTKPGYTTYYCSKCFESKTGDPTEPLGHAWDEGKVTRKPTANRDGVMTYTCVRCKETYKEAIPATGAQTETKTIAIDFTKPEDAEKFEVRGGDAAIEEGVGLTLVSTTTAAIEPAKRNIPAGEDNVVAIPVSGDWTATLEFDFDANGSRGSYEFFGFYGSEGEDYQNLVGIRGGDGAMQDFIRQDGVITEETKAYSAARLPGASTHWYRVEKSGDVYTCYYSADGEEFTEMFSYEGTEIEAEEIVIDAYSGMATGYTYVLKYLQIDTDVPVETKDVNIDFTKPEDAEKFQVVGGDAAIEEGVGLTLVSTADMAIEPAKRNIPAGEENVVLIPVSGDWIATLEFDFNANGSRGSYEFFGFYASEGEDYQNLVGIRGGDGAMQDFIRLDGEITEEVKAYSAARLPGADKHFYRIEKTGDTYICSYSADGEEFTEMFSFESTEIEADQIVIDAYSGMATGYTYILKNLEITGQGGAPVPGDCDHNWGEGVVTTEPTCTADGLKTYTCSKCNKTKSEVIAKLGHDLTETTVDATCTEAGSITRTCSRCDFTQVTTIPALGHDWDEGVVTKQPTATATGVKTYTCARCDATRTETIPATGGTPGETRYELATEIEAGEKYVIVSNGYAVKAEEVSSSDVAEGRTLASAAVTVEGEYITSDVSDDMIWTFEEGSSPDAPDYEGYYITSADGKMLYRSRLGASDGFSVANLVLSDMPASGSINRIFWISEPIGTDGSRTLVQIGQVTNDSDYVFFLQGGASVFTAPYAERGSWEGTASSYPVKLYKVIESGDHTHKWDAGKVTKEATCTAAGEKTYTCECGKTKTEKIPALGHDMVKGEVTAPTCTTAGYTTYTCSRCGVTEKRDNVASTGHNFGEAVVTKPATCTEAGEKTSTCSACGEKKTEAIPATGHAYGEAEVTKEATCTEAGEKTSTCANCGDKKTEAIPALGHAWDEGVVTKEPTTEEEGERTYTCTRCNETKVEPIEKLEEHDCPSKDFTDVPGVTDWAHAGIDYCVANELMNGTSATLFSPKGTVTRAQLVTILYRVEGQPEVTEPSKFTDVPADQWYTDAIAWAAASGVVKGMSETRFAPMNKITREQIATILYRYTEDAKSEGSLEAFPDADKVNEWAQEGMVWAVTEGLITGVKAADGTVTLNPGANATRAQIASIIMRYLEAGEAEAQ